MSGCDLKGVRIPKSRDADSLTGEAECEFHPCRPKADVVAAVRRNSFFARAS